MSCVFHMKVILVVFIFILSFSLGAKADEKMHHKNEPIYVDSSKFLNALSKATHHIDQGRMTMAQLWLRLAYEHAPSAEAKDNVKTLNNRVAQRNPYKIKLSFALAPSNNVNNGTDDEVVILGGLPFAIDSQEQAYQGYVLDTSLALSYSISESARHRTDLIFNGTSRTIRLSGDDSRTTAQEVRGSDFNQSAVSFGVRHLLKTSETLTPLDIQGHIRQNWYGGKLLSYQINVGASQGYILSDRLIVRGAGSIQRTIRQDSSDNSSTRKVISVGARHTFLNTTSLAYDLIYEHNASDSAAISSRAIAVSANLEFPQIKMVKPILQLRMEDRSFPKWNALGNVRSDKSISASIILDLPNIQKYGFSPRFSLGLLHVNSTVSMYDRSSKSATISFNSNF